MSAHILPQIILSPHVRGFSYFPMLYSGTTAYYVFSLEEYNSERCRGLEILMDYTLLRSLHCIQLINYLYDERTRRDAVGWEFGILNGVLAHCAFINLNSGIHWLSSIPQECFICDRLVCPPVFTMIQERLLNVEWWNLAHIHLRPRVTWSLKMSHAHDLWPGQIENIHNAHSECCKTA